MSEGKHAEGPWFVRPEPTPDGLAVIEDGRQHGLFPITCEWSEADLVAAAPDLLSALAGLLSLAEMRPGHLQDYKAAIEIARAAVAKAYGHKAPDPAEAAEGDVGDRAGGK